MEYLNIKNLPITPLAILFVVHILLSLTHGYFLWDKVDNFMHFFGGIAVAATLIPLLRSFKNTHSKSAKFKKSTTLQIILFTLALAIAWEIFEMALDAYADTEIQPDMADTLSDIFLGLCGSIIYTYLSDLNQKKL